MFIVWIYYEQFVNYFGIFEREICKKRRIVRFTYCILGRKVCILNEEPYSIQFGVKK